jgi:outer membrane receptor protein involved in Fe transport
MFSFNNIEQVSVLKGPQGTLFGRNAVAGLVQITTADPTQEFKGNVSAGYGNYETANETMYVSGGLAPELAADLAVQVTTMGEGYGRNLYTGQYTKRTDHDIAARSKFVFTPSSDTKVTLSLDWSGVDGTQDTIRVDPGTTPGSGTMNYGGSVWDVDSNYPGLNDYSNEGAALKIDHDAGSVRFLSISAYRTMIYENHLDLDATPTPYEFLNQHQTDHQISQEFQIQSADNAKIHWSTGLFYFDLKSAYNPINVNVNVPVFLNPLGFGTISTSAATRAESYAAYAQATAPIGNQTNLTVGARYTQEERRLDGSENDFFATLAGANPITTVDTSVTERKPTYRLSLDHHFMDDLMGYVSFNSGFKSGGYNVGTLTDPPFHPETLYAYELGAKSEFLDRRISLNTSAFLYKYKDLQTQYIESDGSIGIVNGAKATLYGLDVDATAAVTDALKVTAAIEALHTRFDSFPDDAPISVPQGGVPVVLGSATGNQLPIAPKFTETLNADYRIATVTSSVNFDVTVERNSGWFTEVDNAVYQHAFTKSNASVRWTSPNQKLKVTAWGNNLSNAEIRSNGATTASGTHVSSYEPPRTYGIRFAYDF